MTCASLLNKDASKGHQCKLIGDTSVVWWPVVSGCVTLYQGNLEFLPGSRCSACPQCHRLEQLDGQYRVNSNNRCWARRNTYINKIIIIFIFLDWVLCSAKQICMPGKRGEIHQRSNKQPWRRHPSPPPMLKESDDPPDDAHSHT